MNHAVMIVACLCIPLGFALGVLFMRIRSELETLRRESEAVGSRRREVIVRAPIRIDAPSFARASTTTPARANGAASH